jgi:hypothetical protein
MGPSRKGLQRTSTSLPLSRRRLDAHGGGIGIGAAEFVPELDSGHDDVHLCPQFLSYDALSHSARPCRTGTSMIIRPSAPFGRRSCSCSRRRWRSRSSSCSVRFGSAMSFVPRRRTIRCFAMARLRCSAWCCLWARDAGAHRAAGLHRRDRRRGTAHPLLDVLRSPAGLRWPRSLCSPRRQPIRFRRFPRANT